MSKKTQINKIARGILSFAAVFCVAAGATAAQTPAPQAQPGTQSPSASPGKPDAQTQRKATGSGDGEETHITRTRRRNFSALSIN